ncbi:MAG: nicotinate (nicotinamide) nucleotide adenylyltransferase [Bryocella sp.]
MQRIAFFGGTFDPPHRGHLAVAKAAADHFALEKVLFAPVATQPLKDHSTPTPFLHRYAMTALATQADPRFTPSLLDAPLLDGPQLDAPSRPNYTVETLERLRATLPASTALFTLVGADSWLQIAQWHDAPRLLALSDWIVAARPGFSLDSAPRALPPEVSVEQQQTTLLLRHKNAPPTQVFFLLHTHEEISATELRVSLESGHLDPNLLPTAVQQYIQKTGLYRREG